MLQHKCVAINDKTSSSLESPLHSSDNVPNKSAQLYSNIRDSSHSNLNVRDKSQDSSFSHKPSSFGNLLVKESHSTLPSGTSKPSLLSILSPIKSSTTSQVQEPSKNHFISESTTPVTPKQSFTSKSTYRSQTARKLSIGRKYK